MNGRAIWIAAIALIFLPGKVTAQAQEQPPPGTVQVPAPQSPPAGQIAAPAGTPAQPGGGQQPAGAGRTLLGAQSAPTPDKIKVTSEEGMITDTPEGPRIFARDVRVEAGEYTVTGQFAEG